METCNSGANQTVLNAKTTDEVCDPYSLLILVLSTLSYVLKTADEG